MLFSFQCCRRSRGKSYFSKFIIYALTMIANIYMIMALFINKAMHLDAAVMLGYCADVFWEAFK